MTNDELKPKNKKSPHELYDQAKGNTELFKKLMLEYGHCIIKGKIDLTPNPDVEKFLEDKYKNQEEAKKCTMRFKGDKPCQED